MAPIVQRMHYAEVFCWGTLPKFIGGHLHSPAEPQHHDGMLLSGGQEYRVEAACAPSIPQRLIEVDQRELRFLVQVNVLPVPVALHRQQVPHRGQHHLLAVEPARHDRTCSS